MGCTVLTGVGFTLLLWFCDSEGFVLLRGIESCSREVAQVAVEAAAEGVVTVEVFLGLWPLAEAEAVFEVRGHERSLEGEGGGQGALEWPCYTEL